MRDISSLQSQKSAICICVCVYACVNVCMGVCGEGGRALRDRCMMCRDRWMMCNFTSFPTVFQSYQDDGQMIIKG